MKRFLTFRFETYGAGGGMWDFEKDFDNISDAINYLYAYKSDPPPPVGLCVGTWEIQVYDLNEMKIVFEEQIK